MTIQVGDPFAAFTYMNPVKGSHSIEVIYFAAFIGSLDQIKLHPEDHSEYRWIAETEIEQVMILNGAAESHPEIQAMRKAFSLWRGATLNFVAA